MSSKTKEFLKKTTIFWVLVLLIVIMAFLSPAFLKGRNVANIVKQISINGILAVGMTMVIITGGIDLSVGSVVALLRQHFLVRQKKIIQLLLQY